MYTIGRVRLLKSLHGVEMEFRCFFSSFYTYSTYEPLTPSS
jgi:hypothetical protein